jgi:hypothetical protein
MNRLIPILTPLFFGWTISLSSLCTCSPTPPPPVWALKPPSWALVHRATYAPMIYELFGPQMALAYWLDAISQGPKISRLPGPNPLSLALVIDMHASKTLCTGLYKSFMHKQLIVTHLLALGEERWAAPPLWVR